MAAASPRTSVRDYAILSSTALLVACPFSGGLLALALVVPSFRWFGWIGLFTFACLFSSRTGTVVAYAGGFLGAAVYHGIGLIWMCLCIEGIFAPVWFFCTAAATLCAVVSLVLGRAFIRATEWPMAISFPFVWLTYEYLRHGIFVLVDGNGMVLLWQGLALAGFNRIAQIADLAGVFALTWLLACMTGGAYDLYEFFAKRDRKRWRQALGASGFAGASLMIAWLYGHWRVTQPLDDQGPTIALVCGSLPPASTLRSVADVSPDVDLFAWPETAVDGWLDVGPRSIAGQLAGVSGGPAELLPMVASRLDAPVIAGVRRTESEGGVSGQKDSYNSLAFVDPCEGIQSLYDKRHLTPFIEFTPLWMRRLGWSASDAFPLARAVQSEFQRGKRADPFLLNAHDLGREFYVAGTICYDVCFPGIHRLYMNREPGRRPDLFVCVMNETFDASGIVSELSLLHTRLRAIECRRPYYRVSEGGITATVDSCGRVLQKATAPRTSHNALVGRVPGDHRATTYVKYGDWLPIASVLVVMGYSMRQWISRPNVVQCASSVVERASRRRGQECQ